MKIKLLSLVLLFSGYSFAACTTENDPNNNPADETPQTDMGTGETNGYKMVWEDTFNSGALNETNNWSVEVNGNGGGNSELQYYRRENISVGTEPVSGNGCLIITAKKENYLGKTGTSGRLTTQNKMTVKYGKIEARIKLPKTANGLWPAFWTLGADIPTVGWPKCGEIDILEMGNANGIKNGTQETYFNGACHWGESWNNGVYPNYARATTNPYSLQDDFHLYTLIWDETAIRMYLDLDKYPNNAPYYEMTINGEDVAGNPRRYFHKPNFVILNLAIGGNFTQLWDINKITALNAANNYQAKMYIDFVRVYQKGVAGEELYSKGKTSVPAVSQNQKYRIYPVPANEELRIEGPATPDEIKVFSISGQELITASNTSTVNTSALKTGNYLIRISQNNGQSETHSFAKK